jgi:hypothetical protein
VSNIGLGDAIVQPGLDSALVRDLLKGRYIHHFGTQGQGSNYSTQERGNKKKNLRKQRVDFYTSEEGGAINPGETRDLFFVSTVPREKARGTTIRNCATVDPNNAIQEANEDNNTFCLATEVLPN